MLQSQYDGSSQNKNKKHQHCCDRHRRRPHRRHCRLHFASFIIHTHEQLPLLLPLPELPLLLLLLPPTLLLLILTLLLLLLLLLLMLLLPLLLMRLVQLLLLLQPLLPLLLLLRYHYCCRPRYR